MTTLDELRRANLQEQRSPSPVRVPSAEPANGTAPETAAAPVIRSFSPSPTSNDVEPVVSVHSAPDSDEAVIQVDPSNELVERVRASIARKRVHPTGVKATVDMPPELFWRVKRYCRDHNNATVRQVFLDLMIAFLDEEGY